MPKPNPFTSFICLKMLNVGRKKNATCCIFRSFQRSVADYPLNVMDKNYMNEDNHLRTMEVIKKK